MKKRALKKQCKRGHDLSLHSRLRKNGFRFCEECRKVHHLGRQSKGYKLKSSYGITLNDFDRMLNAQDNRCAVCREVFKSSFNTHVDHSHTTGKVRGLLCTQCNSGLGNFKDSLGTMERAMTYLKEQGWQYEETVQDADNVVMKLRAPIDMTSNRVNVALSV